MDEVQGRDAIVLAAPGLRTGPQPFALQARGETLVVTEIAGEGEGDRAPSEGPREVSPLHVHHADDEAWHVIAGALRFRFRDRTFLAEAGSTVLVPAGVAHTFGGQARYLLITSTRVQDLISELHEVDRSEHAAVFRKYESELLE